MYRKVRSGSTKSPDAIAIALFKGDEKLPKAYRTLDADGSIAAALTRPEFTADSGSVTTVYPGGKAPRVYLLGMGEKDSFKADVLRKATGTMVKAAFSGKVKQIALHLDEALRPVLDANQVGRIVGEAAMLANFSFDDFKGAAGGKNGKDKPIDLTLAAGSGVKKGIDHGLKVGEATNIARTLAATPPNVANPKYLASYCRKMAKKVGLTCKVITGSEAEKAGMGGLLAVGSGGSTPPQMICLEHAPTAKAKKQPPVMLVGKSITFDTGGYSLKVGGSMQGMKYDKCGGMAVIGAMYAIASLKLPVHVVGILPAAENMIDTAAYRVDDIITFANGVTAEITNTDAEGRLVLADALSWGTRTYKPQAVIDLATLTGGVVVALGSYCAGAWCGHTNLRSHLFDAGDDTGERLWHLPLWDEHRALMKGSHSDLVNSAATREAHPIQGAAFLSFFVGEDAPTKMPTLPWCHLDIAAVADSKADTPPIGKGPTGFGVRLLTRAIETWADLKL